jgi:long-chain acyl-CoA synthetase
MSQVDPIFAALTAPGMPFEVSERNGLRQFVNMPHDLGALIEAARRHGEKTFIVEDGVRLSFNDVFARRDALVPALGISKGDRFAICMRNNSAWMIAFMAIIRAGGVAALINSRGAPEELAAAVADVSPVVVIADQHRSDLLRAGGFTGRILMPEDFPMTPAGELPARPVNQPGDPAAILFTSGTTGRVKGALLSHLNLTTGLLSMQLSGVMILQGYAAQMGVSVETLMASMPQQAVLLVYPLFHISGLGSAFLSPLFAGSKIVIMRRWDPAEALRLIAQEQITMFTGVPTMLWDLLHSANLAEADLSSLRNIASGGQALPVNLLDAIRAACPKAAMGTGYGMTESAGAVAQAVGQDFIRNRASAGRVLPLVDMRILGPNQAELPRGETGEIVVRGAQVMTGYWNRPEDTAEVLSADGWLHTGDVGYIDEEGYVFIFDRKKDMVISGGENIYCAEVERVLGLMPGITECATFGIADERLGELLVAVVCAANLTDMAIVDFVKGHLAHYKAPGRIAFSPDPLPRNAVGKIDKMKLRALWPDLSGEN